MALRAHESYLKRKSREVPEGLVPFGTLGLPRAFSFGSAPMHHAREQCAVGRRDVCMYICVGSRPLRRGPFFCPAQQLKMCWWNLVYWFFACLVWSWMGDGGGGAASRKALATGVAAARIAASYPFFIKMVAERGSQGPPACGPLPQRGRLRQ